MEVSDFVIVFRNVCVEKRFTIEIIGTRPDSNHFLDKLDKADCNNWIMRINLPSPNALQIDKLNTEQNRNTLIEFFRKTLQETPTPLSDLENVPSEKKE